VAVHLSVLRVRAARAASRRHPSGVWSSCSTILSFANHSHSTYMKRRHLLKHPLSRLTVQCGSRVPNMCYDARTRMTRRLSIRVLTAALLHCSLVIGQSFRPEIPRSWDDREVQSFELPLAQADRSPRYMTSSEYYALNERVIYRSYPVYAPGREPAG
jgi:hypothetical protein